MAQDYKQKKKKKQKKKTCFYHRERSFQDSRTIGKLVL